MAFHTGDTASAPPRATAAAKLEQELEHARKRLIETGTRNRLVHTNRAAKKPATLGLFHGDVESLFGRLRAGTAGLRFQPDAGATGRERRRKDDAQPEPEAGEFDFGGRDAAADTLQTKLGEAGLEKKLLKFAREAKTLEEEQGIDILYLAIGFLRWFEDEKSEVFREAPLILVPVSLVKDARRSTYVLRGREDDIATNLPLAERLLEDGGIALPEIPEGDEWTAASYFDAVAEAIAPRSRWSIDRGGLELGLFSFAKQLMFRELSRESWPQGKILDHPLLRGLLQDGFAAEPALFAPGMKLDERFSPADLVHVVDADGSQALAIETVRAGRNLVVQGPPGTGKSQTIANIIAAAVHDGKTVLFIAEKMVALDVVHARLDKAGLGRLCLQLHSRAASKRLVAAELERTLAFAASAADVAAETAELSDARDKLNGISAGLHAPIEATGTTPHRALGDLARAKGLGLPPCAVALPGAEGWTGADFAAISKAARTLARIVAEAGPAGGHPWSGVRNLDLQPFDVERLAADAGALAPDLERFAELAANAAAIAHAGPAATRDDVAALARVLARLQNAPRERLDMLRQLDGAAAAQIAQALALAKAGAQFKALKAADGAVFTPMASAGDASDARTELARGAASFFARWGGRYRAASVDLAGWLAGPLPKVAGERLTLADKLVALQAAQKNWTARQSAGPALLGPLWLADETDFDGLDRAATWLAGMRATGLAGSLLPAYALLDKPATLPALSGRLDADLAGLGERWARICERTRFGEATERGTSDIAGFAARLRLWAGGGERYAQWAELARADLALRQHGLAAFADVLAAGGMPPGRALEELRHGRAEALWNRARQVAPVLASPALGERGKHAATFARLDHKRRHSVAGLIMARHAAAMPRGSVGAMGIIRGEIARKRGHKTIRRLMADAGRTLQEIKPVFLMSPISVAQFLPPGSVEFDLLVIDEASQVRPEEALGVIARCKQMVVVGDVRQLPPTNFFARLMSDEPEEEESDEAEEATPAALKGAAKAVEMESILTLCEARGIGARRLRWHYRSRHPSLIEVSNEEFYDGDLVVPPSPHADRSKEGMMLRRVAGVYDRGGKRTNAIEAQAVVAAVAEHAAQRPGQSLGIVTFSTSQRDLIAMLLEEERRKSDTLDAYVRDMTEEVFVKNLENVQGDERDAILISVGYGPVAAGGRLSAMAFGPVSGEGGERRLNVLFTRARRRCEIFLSFDPGDIDLARTKSRGAMVLKRFLTFAETGVLKPPSSTGADFDSPFEEDVARVVRNLGYVAEPQVGSAGFRIDLAVRHPEKAGQYMLAVECDGATYHSAVWARERDRLRQEVLEQMGWHFHRIWSTDWFHRRAAEIARLELALKNAKTAKAIPAIVPKPPAPVPPPVVPAASQTNGTLYAVANFTLLEGGEPHELSTAKMAQIVARIVKVEGPVHEEEIARRVASLFGKDRAGSRILESTKAGLAHLARLDAHLKTRDGFWLTTAQEAACPVRDRSAAPASLQKAAMLPPLEIATAIRRVLDDNGEVPRDELLTAVARLFGFQRTGPDLRGALEAALEAMLREGAAMEREGRIGAG